ncbi:MAG: hypothetical protein IKN72_05550 [Clostridia bacterium]|nr:hypothetical protein [Clostridia bacterium]
MTDDEILLAHARDLKTQCADRSMLTHTAFLDLHQRTVLKPLETEQRAFVSTFYYGGAPDAERTVAVFVPSFFDADNAETLFASQPEDNPLALLRLEKDRFHTLSHRDYLGALMGLGVKRELLGDIVTDDAGAYVLCLKKAATFLKDNLTSVGRASVTVREAPLSALQQHADAFEERFASVASVRLDAVLAAAFSLSRTRAAAAIESGVVFVNSVQTMKADQKLDPGDKLVLRGRGKALLFEIKGESKKGRTHIVLRRYK